MKEVVRKTAEKEWEEKAIEEFRKLGTGELKEVTVVMVPQDDPNCRKRFRIYWTIARNLKFPVTAEGETVDGKPCIVFRKV